MLPQREALAWVRGPCLPLSFPHDRPLIIAASHHTNILKSSLLLQNASHPSPLKLGACGFGARPSSGWPFAGSVAALGPDSPLRHNLTLSGCGACLEVYCGHGDRGDAKAARQVRGDGGGAGAVACTAHNSIRCMPSNVMPHLQVRNPVPGDDSMRSATAFKGPNWWSNYSMLFSLQAGCLAGPGGNSTGVIVTVTDGCPGCAGQHGLRGWVRRAGPASILSTSLHPATFRAAGFRSICLMG